MSNDRLLWSQSRPEQDAIFYNNKYIRDELKMKRPAEDECPNWCRIDNENVKMIKNGDTLTCPECQLRRIRG